MSVKVVAVTNCRAAICHIPRLFFSLYNAIYVVDYYGNIVMIAITIKEADMFFKFTGSSLYQMLLNKLYDSTRIRKQATAHRDASKKVAVDKQMPLQDAVWHRSKSARYLQNQSMLKSEVTAT